MRNKGCANVNSRGRGNHYVEMKVVVPEDLTPRASELLEALQREFDGEGEEGADAEDEEEAPTSSSMW